MYFSPRHSSAPDTDGGRDAAAASAGSGAVAGVGAAWLWQASILNGQRLLCLDLAPFKCSVLQS